MKNLTCIILWLAIALSGNFMCVRYRVSRGFVVAVAAAAAVVKFRSAKEGY